MMRKIIARLCNKIIISGVIGLVVFTPIAIGTVHVWAFSVMELVVIGLVLAWMTKLLCMKDESTQETISERQDLVCKIPSNRFGFVKTPLNVPLLIFVGIVFFQITPLPMSAIRFLSPETYEIYSNYLPDNEDHSKLSSLPVLHNESTSGMTSRAASGQWRTMSINPHSTRTELFKVLSYVAVFFLIVNNFKTRRHINYLILAIILVGCFEAVYGFYEYSTGNKNILFAPRKYNTGRLAGTYVNPNHLAGLLEMVLPIAISFGICRKEGFAKNNTTKLNFNPEEIPFKAKLSLFFNKRNFTNILLFISIALLIGALFLSQSRMGVMGFLVSIWIFGIYILKKYCKRNGLVFAVGGLLAILFFASWLGLNPLYKRFSTTSELSIKNRTDIWKDTGGILRDFPLLGTGKGTFVDIFRKYKTIPTQLTYDHAHNDYIELLSEMGLFGLAVTGIGGGFFAYKIINKITKRRDDYVKIISVGFLCSIAAIIVHCVTDFNMFITANALLFSIILALLTLTPHLIPSTPASAKGRHVGIISKPLYALIILLTIFLSVPVLKTCMADVYYKRAKALMEPSPVRPKDGETAPGVTNTLLSIPYMQKCISLDKSNSVYHFDLGRMFLQLIKTERNPDKFEQNAILAVEQFEDAIIYNPCYFLAHSALGIVYNLHRTTNPADKLTPELDKFVEIERRYLNKAVALNPSSASNNYLAGYMYVMDWNTLLQGDKEMALRYLRTAIELNPADFNKVLQSSWPYIQDYNWIERVIPDNSDSYMGLARFFDEKRIFPERNIAWEEARKRNGKPILPSIFEDNNFIINGSFEYEPGSAWKDWSIEKVDGTVIRVVNSKSVDGNNSLKILFDGTKDVNFHHVIQTIRVEGGAKYILTGYIKTQNITSKSGIRMRLNCKNAQEYTEPFLGTRDWDGFALEFYTPEGCNVVNIMVYRKGLGTVKKELISGIVWIDGLQLSKII